MKSFYKQFIIKSIPLFLLGVMLISFTACESETEENSFYKQVDKTFDNLEYIEEKANEQKNIDIDEEY